MKFDITYIKSFILCEYVSFEYVLLIWILYLYLYRVFFVFYNMSNTL